MQIRLYVNTESDGRNFISYISQMRENGIIKYKARVKD